MPKEIGIDQLRFFVLMVQGHVDDVARLAPGYNVDFWRTLRKRCPDLIHAIDEAFTGEWSTLTFTNEIASLTLTYGDIVAATEVLRQPHDGKEDEVSTYDHE